MIQAVAACANHPQREALGICVQCRTRVCAECVTRVDGINLCVSCLASRAVQGHKHAERPLRRSPMPRLSALAHLAVLWVLCWIMLSVLLPGGS